MSFVLVDTSPAPAGVAALAAHDRATAGAPASNQQRHAAPIHNAPMQSDKLAGGRNRRWSERQMAAMSGVVGANVWPEPLACQVLDLSKHGAMLELVDGADGALPECLTLVFYNRRTRCEANCVVRWRRDNRVGVCFAGPVRSMIGR